MRLMRNARLLCGRPFNTVFAWEIGSGMIQAHIDNRIMGRQRCFDAVYVSVRGDDGATERLRLCRGAPVN